jgi:Xaa-Pro dipeptidase
MNDTHTNRLAAVRRRMEEMGLTSLLVSEPAALWYLTGETIHPGERLTVLVIPARGSAFWIRNRLFPLTRGMGLSPEEAEKAGLPADISFEDGEDGIALLAGRLPEGTVGIDKFWPSHFLLSLMEKRKDLAYRNGSPAVDRTRAIKDGEEIDAMRRASFLNDRAMERIARFLHEGVTEKECADRLLAIYKEEGAEGFSFPPIVSFSPHGADPHHMPDDTVFHEGDVVLFDMGCRKDHYCSDMTRTFLTGTPSEEEKKVHTLVREAGELAESLVRPGIPLADLDRAARDYIAKGGYGPFFTHRLGHFIGIKEHEEGEVSSSSPLTAEPGMIFSIEPGVYLPGKFGVRIEDLVLVTNGGCEVLNHAPRGWEIP